MKTLLKISIPLLLIVVVFLLIRNQYKTTVLVSPAVEGTAVNAVTGTLEVWANVDINIKAENRGQILEHKAKPGEIVEKGDVITIQESEDLELRLEQTQIRLDAAKKRAEKLSPLKLDLETIAEEVESTQLAVKLGQSSESALERVLRERQKKEIFLSLEAIQQEETLKILQAQLEQLELQKEQMVTRAPFGGTIVAYQAYVGDLVNGGQNLMRIIAHGRYIVMELTEEDYAGVKDGQKVTIRLASYPDKTFEGKVVRLVDAANVGNKTRDVIVTVKEPDSVMVPGLTGEGYLIKGERENAVLIPRRALIGNIVYVIKGGSVELRRVKPGYLGLNKAEILEGIAVGEQVVLENQNLLKNGDAVETTVLPFNP